MNLFLHKTAAVAGMVILLPLSMIAAAVYLAHGLYGSELLGFELKNVWYWFGWSMISFYWSLWFIWRMVGHCQRLQNPPQRPPFADAAVPVEPFDDGPRLLKFEALECRD